MTTAFVGVYVDRMVTCEVVRAAVARLEVPEAVAEVTVDDSSITEMFDCRVVVYLAGQFDRATGAAIARRYAARLSTVLEAPASSLNDLLRAKDLPLS